MNVIQTISKVRKIMLKRKNELQQNPTIKDTLFIIGNGFDIWQDLHTSFAEFQQYYLTHREEIVHKLRIKKHIRNLDGQSVSINDVELIYGNPFNPEELNHEFWNSFETSLCKLNAERINLFFGKERKGLRLMEKSIRNANRILREAFCDWIATITIDEKEPNYLFGDNCLFINFNYTDTLFKRFRVQDTDEFHIHGKASDKKSIIFGHSLHPQLPEKFLSLLHGRFHGLSLIENILYETDKHVRDNINFLCMFLALHGTRVEEIRNIYVLGHSMGLPDIEYFSFLANATRVHTPEELETNNDELSEKIDPLNELNLRLQYVINRWGYNLDDELIDPEQKKAVARQFELEQKTRDQVFQKEVLKIFKKRVSKNSPKTAKTHEIIPRAEDATWHISCRSDRSKQWVERLMKEFGCKNFKLYPTIDKCLEPYKK